MGGCYSIDGVIPVVHPEAFLHPDAVLIGDVHIAAGCYIGPFVSLRGDFGRIEIRTGANLQDSCTVHCFPGREAIVDVDGHVGHGAVLHGCHVGPRTLIGIGAIVMDGCVIEDGAFVGAHSYVNTNTRVPAGWLFAGTPAKAVRQLKQSELGWKANGTGIYQELAQRSRETLRRVDPLTAAEVGRPVLPVPAERARPLSEHRDGAGL